MKREQEPNKLYYDIDIQHNPEKIDKLSGIGSVAEKTIDLKDPLIENPGDYNLSISKFRIDTESVPLFIPEIKSEQLVSNLNNGFLETKYEFLIQLTYQNILGSVDKNKTTFLDSDYNPTKITTKVYNYSIFRRMNLNKATDLKRLIIKYKDDKTVYINTLDPIFYIYDYNEFYWDISRTIDERFDDICSENNISGIGNGYRPCFIDTHKGLRIAFSRFVQNKIGKVSSFKLYFSANLYKYIGQGFPVLWGLNDNHKNWFSIDNDNNLNYDTSTNFKYYYSSYDFRPNWHCLKALVIGSDTLPIVPEFLPIASNDGFLTHYKTDDYIKGLEALGMKYEEEDKSLFNQNSQMILDIFYPLSSSPGDIRSCVIHTRDDIDNGQNIELLPASPITRFNIWVKWLDTYNNLHDLYLNPGSSVDIRICFTKKTVLKEDLAEGVSTLMEALPEKKPKKEKRSNGRPDGIVIEGADRYGFVHL